MTTPHHRSPGDCDTSATGTRVAFYLTSSVDGQEAALRAYLNRHPELRLVTTYRDHGPATRPIHRRPELLQAIQAAVSREFDILLTPAIDRVFRHTEHLARLVDELETTAVTLRTADGRFNSGAPVDRLMAKMFTIVAEYEREVVQRHETWEREHTPNPHKQHPGSGRTSEPIRRHARRRWQRRGGQ